MNNIGDEDLNPNSEVMLVDVNWNCMSSFSVCSSISEIIGSDSGRLCVGMWDEVVEGWLLDLRLGLFEGGNDYLEDDSKKFN
jgi:hypothetical protein